MSLLTAIVPLLRRMTRTELQVEALQTAPNEVQSVSSTSTLTLTKPETLVTVTASATVSFPAASSANAGWVVAVHNAHTSSNTVNGVSLAANAYAQWFSSGSAWRRIA